MFTRSLAVLVVTLVTSGTLAVASATATDDPAPKPQGGSQGCVDTMRPVSRLGGKWKSAFRNGVIRGIAIDQGCGATGAGKLKRVDVAIARKAGKRCQSLLPSGRLGQAGACKHVWLHAKGKGKWSLRLKHKLPRGKHLIATRAIDSACNVEH